MGTLAPCSHACSCLLARSVRHGVQAGAACQDAPTIGAIVMKMQSRCEMHWQTPSCAWENAAMRHWRALRKLVYLSRVSRCKRTCNGAQRAVLKIACLEQTCCAVHRDLARVVLS